MIVTNINCRLPLPMLKYSSNDLQLCHHSLTSKQAGSRTVSHWRNIPRLISYLIAFFSSFTLLPAYADCFDAAARYQRVNPMILRAIAWQESHYKPNAIRRNDNGSIDYGLMQINSIHLSRLSRYGISSNTLMQPCASVYIAAWHLRQKMNKFGNTWQAVGAYHSETPVHRDRYARQIVSILNRWKNQPNSRKAKR